ncbi:MAG: hypothetical protein HOP14_03520 [Acidobacteria bacterium]|nr:hypothetical protein [Acidobacteriota bacterium]
MISDLIVWASLAFTAAFVLAWGSSRALRAWIEQPKYRFLEAVRAYDRTPPAASHHEGKTTP